MGGEGRVRLLSYLDINTAECYHDSVKRKQRKVLDQVEAANPGTDWADVEALLVHVGAVVVEGSGSSVSFFMGEEREYHLTVDRPHPRRECGRSFLRTTGHLEERP